MTHKKDKYLYYLDELPDYKVAHKHHDVRGWIVKDKDNRVIGKVDNLLVNKNLEKVVYLDVEVDESIIEANHDPYGQPANPEIREFINKKGENHIIVPIGLVSINEDPDYVYTDSINYQTFAETKRMEHRTAVDRDYEEVVLRSYNRNREQPAHTPERKIAETDTTAERRTAEADIEARRRTAETDRETGERTTVNEREAQRRTTETGFAGDRRREEELEREKRYEDDIPRERTRQREADELDYDRRKNDPDYQEQATRYSESVPDENYDEDYERRRQRRETDFREDQPPLKEEGKRKTDWNPEAPYNKEYEDKYPEEKSREHRRKGRIPDDDSFYERKEFDDRNFRRRE